MEYNFITNIESCYIDIPSLLYYSHIPSAIIALFFGFFILLKGEENRLEKKVFFFISLTFFLWVIVEGAIWLLYNSVDMMFLWSFLGLLYALLHILSLYFVYVMIDHKDILPKIKYIFAVLLLPIVYLTPTVYNIVGFDIENCQAIEGSYFIAYRYFIGIVSIIWICALLYIRYKKAEKESKKQILLLGFGVLSFLFLFSWSEIVGSFTESFEITQYGLFGMPILLAFLAYLIVKFHTFNIKLIATQALVWALVIMIGAEFAFIQSNINKILTAVTLMISAWLGLIIVRSVKKEIQQKEELAKLNVDLKNLMVQRESLVHLVTHKVKGSFTRSKYIFAGILDGTFGDISPDVKKYAQQGLESDDAGINTVDLVLNAANLQKGTVKYDMKELDFKDVILKILAEKKVQAEAKGLVVESSIHDSKDDDYRVLGDAFWLKEAVNNLIENSIKYTPTGKIVIKLEDGNKKIKFSIKDTGLGITDEDKKNLFTEGGRGKESVKTNVDSTGYGLYTVKLVIEAHKGRVWAESEGAGKGSTFYIELGAVK
ncbi:hypothetical protein A2456_00290 [Candidatus Nomurabacteria bacterium RIFOXYC2_FULL_36_19]|uniref:histidine kinase n=1 Tax=Candidatus Nomurabacteria bacterium RIFOXYC2_FULL_36_19 TaxID=1801806 RepID=A0A1F6YRR5_9BACT|nr:MAG: hypothetical protein A2456_00290 [Candidatus Nomurabacteria bacterium RIFOXYC2_FULL_36_19]OGJ15052.1 MAG: hypothetical protein A2554_02225 [Candidatus Nomurabacteria bacterium RIFOXYD2_FULL_35_12]